ncbi:MAG TPA: peptide chain release factor-like protein [Verrucomicrobiae bacterium]
MRHKIVSTFDLRQWLGGFYTIHCRPSKDIVSVAVRIVADYAGRMSALPIGVEKETQLAQRMARLGVREEDIEETFVRSGGHGGQNVNKTSTCVMLVHRPTGTQVKCQTTRKQGQNRSLARELLLNKIETQRAARTAAERQQAEKLRRQKRKRSRAAKERILADKARRSQKKSLRRSKDRD